MKSEFWHYLGIGICAFFITIGIGGCSYLVSKGNALEYQAQQKSNH